jgi:hypothetical protein
MVRVLHLDLGKRTGWAVDDLNIVGRPLWGTVDLGGGKDEYGVAGEALAKWIHLAIDMHQPNILSFERPLDPRNMGMPNRGKRAPGETDAEYGERRPSFFVSYEAIRMTHGLAMIADVVGVKDLGRDQVREVYVASWRARFIGGYPRKQPDGKRSDPKKLTIARCYALGWRLTDDNAADACGGWAYMKSELNPSFRYDNGELAIRLKPGKMRAA